MDWGEGGISFHLAQGEKEPMAIVVLEFDSEAKLAIPTNASLTPELAHPHNAGEFDVVRDQGSQGLHARGSVSLRARLVALCPGSLVNGGTGGKARGTDRWPPSSAARCGASASQMDFLMFTLLGDLLGW